MKYANPAAFRQALDQRIKNEVTSTGLGVGRLRKRVAFELFLRRLHDPESFRAAYGGDPLDDDALAYVVDPARCVEDTVHHYLQPVRWSNVAGVPITYVVNTRDRPIPPDSQEEMAQRLPQPATVVRVDSGHLLPVTDPACFARILARVAG